MIMPASFAPVALAAFLVAGADEAPSVRLMYLDAMAQERAVREALADPQASTVVLKAVRTVVRAYESLVRQHPTSSYCDNALWQAGRLSLDAFDRFAQTPDREAGIRLLETLAMEYPASKLVVQARQQLAALRSVPIATRGPIATITDIRRVVLPDAVRVVIDLDRETSFHEERIPDPSRIFVDFSSTRTAPSLATKSLRFDGDQDIVREVRLGRHPHATTRVVLDARGVSSYSVYPLYNPYRLVIDCVRAVANAHAALPPFVTTPAASTAATRGTESVAPPVGAPEAVVPVEVDRPPLKSRVPLPSWGHLRPFATPLIAVLPPPPIDRDVVALMTSPPSPSPGGKPAPSRPGPVPNIGSGFSMARQLGLGVSRIVIDPGHGGHDPGAKANGITEAGLVLDIALRLEKALRQAGDFEVILTRRADDFVPLQERTAIANREGADLFLSIHANASDNRHARGVETYFLHFADTSRAAAVAARENAASGQSMGALPDFVKAIALNSKRDESRDFATFVQRSLVSRLRSPANTVKNLGVKQAPFLVLIGASMPSALVEVAFLTNAREVKLVKSASYRQRIAEALLSALVDYRKALGPVRTVAHQ